MSLWQLTLVVAAAGAIGGIVAALISPDRGLPWPTFESSLQGRKVFRPGFVGLVVVGAIAAVASWGLYGPFVDVPILGGDETGEIYTITLGALVGALLIGVGGSKWLSSYVENQLLENDKSMLQTAGGAAARALPSEEVARLIETAPPAVAMTEALALDLPSQAQPH